MEGTATVRPTLLTHCLFAISTVFWCFGLPKPLATLAKISRAIRKDRKNN